MTRQRPHFRNRPHEDMSCFGNRLYSLMEGKGILTARELAKQMVDCGMDTLVKPRDDFPDERNIRGSIQRRIENHLNAQSVDEVPGKYLMAYCRFFECSADFLFGITEVKSSLPGIRELCEMVGLSESAVMGLCKITSSGKDAIEHGWNSKEYRTILSKLLASNGFIKFVIGIRELSDAYEWEQSKKSPLDEAYRKLGPELFSLALKCVEASDEENLPELTPELVAAVHLVRDKMDEGYAQQLERENHSYVKIARFNLNEVFTEWVDEQFQTVDKRNS